MNTKLRAYASSSKQKYIRSLRKLRIAFATLAGRSGAGVILHGKHFTEYDFYLDLTLTEAMTMVIALKKHINLLESHIQIASNIEGEKETLEALQTSIAAMQSLK